MSDEFVPSPEFLARVQRMQDAVELKQPDQIPLVMGFGYFLADYGGITRQELHDNWEKSQEILEKATLQFQPDTSFGAWGTPEQSKAVGDRMTKWPGYRLGEQGSFQFDEHEFMKPEDYDALLHDPSDFAIRTYLPRAFEKLEGLAMLPNLGMALYGYYSLGNTAALLAPPVIAALEALKAAGEATAVFQGQQMASAQRMAALGFPGPAFLVGALVEAPFDFMSDTLRGMRGIMLDMLRLPDKLLAAEEKVLKTQVDYAVSFCKATGFTNAFIPLHRGSDGFMSLKQFEKFYWPQLKEMVVQLVEAGITPTMYYEGVWDQRLEYLNELPKGKTAGLFQDSDIFKVKEVVGDTLCIMGGMPIPLLKNGSASEIREQTHKVCQEVGKGGGFMMTSTVLELEGIKPESLQVWADATREFGVY
ncbi:MAG: hypothetical protein KC434_06585 [Anaerolineales bacterium]|nr:hypothetical protein [Anaerolineales bacterium]